MHRSTILVPLFLLCAPLCVTGQPRAQEPRTVPAAAHHAWGNTVLSGSSGVFRAQLWFDGGQLPTGTVISALSLRLPPQESSAYTASLSITLANTIEPFNGLIPNLSQNLGGATPAFTGPVNVPASASAPSPDQPVEWYFLDTPFTFTGPNLLIDLHYTSLVLSGPIRVDGVTFTPPVVHLTERVGCGARIIASYASGVFTVRNNSQLPANQPVTLMAGIENAVLGTVPLPLDLSAFGFPGCDLRVAPAVLVPAVTNAAGGLQLTFPFAIPSTSAMLSVQLIYLGASGTTLLTTNAVHSNFASAIPFGELLSTDGTTAQIIGPNKVPVVMLQ